MIPRETVDQIWQTISAYSEDEAKDLVTLMGNEQPAILAYLLASSEHEAFDEEESETVIYVGVVVWQIMKHGLKYLHTVSEETLERVRKENENLLDKLAADSIGDFLAASEAMVEGHPEPEVLRFITEMLIEGEDGTPESPPIRDENLGVGFFHLMVVLDAFIQSGE